MAFVLYDVWNTTPPNDIGRSQAHSVPMARLAVEKLTIFFFFVSFGFAFVCLVNVNGFVCECLCAAVIVLYTRAHIDRNALVISSCRCSFVHCISIRMHLQNERQDGDDDGDQQNRFEYDELKVYTHRQAI